MFRLEEQEILVCPNYLKISKHGNEVFAITSYFLYGEIFSSETNRFWYFFIPTSSLTICNSPGKILCKHYKVSSSETVLFNRTINNFQYFEYSKIIAI